MAEYTYQVFTYGDTSNDIINKQRATDKRCTYGDLIAVFEDGVMVQIQPECTFKELDGTIEDKARYFTEERVKEHNNNYVYGEIEKSKTTLNDLDIKFFKALEAQSEGTEYEYTVSEIIELKKSERLLINELETKLI